MTHENNASTNMKTGHSDRLGTVRNINKVSDGLRHSREFMTMTNPLRQPGTTRVTGSGTKLVEPEADYEETSKQRRKA